METGTKISAAAHLALIGWALVGGVFRSEPPPPFQTRDVSVVSARQFAALMAAQQPPVTAPAPSAPSLPDPAQDMPEAPAVAPAPEIDQQPPDATPAPAPEAAPEDLPQPLPAQPQSGVADTAPALPSPDAQAVLLPSSLPPSPQPTSRPADRVAPQPVAPPPPDTTPDEVTRPDVAPDKGAEKPQPDQQATAPEAANDHIVTEAETVSDLAPTTSVRPPARRPSPPKPTPPRAKPSAPDPVRAALEEALGGTAPPAPVPQGPPMTSGEKDDLIVAVSKCWNVGSLSSAALATTVVVAVSMSEDGKPVMASIRMLSSSGGSDASAAQAFGAARRAIIRCGAKGYNLPADKYGQWRDIEMTFNPERMRIR